jgi:tetratricopeptide (TPR) repeat protein
MADPKPELRDLFCAALDCPTPQVRAPYLDKACQGRPELRARVAALLQAHADATGFLREAARGTDETVSQPAPGPPGSATPPVQQQEHPGASAISLVRQSPSLGRYALLGEVARGGMGAVLRVHDLDFGRTLALKVMLATASQLPTAEQRFLEEARLTGQLQHPGIPPVHELGRLDSGLPFFAMRLVKGNTLAALLQQRTQPGQDLPRFLSIFRQVCQTLAYVHSRGIIHRDLKPLNIMVGAFGEVQVMDWGLAKQKDEGGRMKDESDQKKNASDSSFILHPSSLTQTGEVMGTPGYTAPEQARGEIRTLDERCDVFGLGALLCEILTGQPPFRQSSTRLRLLKAADGDLTDAYLRLDQLAGCIDAELIDLTRRCLAPNKEDRPRDACQMAEAMERYEAQVQERLRQVELEKAQVEVQVAEQRKRAAVEQARADEEQRRRQAEHARVAAERQKRRAVLAAAAAGLLLLAGLSGAILWYQRDQADRREEEILRQARGAAERQEAERKREQSSHDVRQEFEQARSVREDLQKKLRAPGGVFKLLNTPAEWSSQLERAKLSLKHAQALAKNTNGILGGPLDKQMRALQEGLRSDEDDFQLALALEKVRQDKAAEVNGRIDHAGAARAYTMVFQKAKLVLPEGEVGVLAGRIQQSPIREQLLAALDDWALAAWLKREPKLLQQLLAVSRRADSDPWRQQLRTPQFWNDPGELDKLIRAFPQGPKSGRPAGQLSPQLLSLVGYLLQARGKEREGWLRQAQAAYAADFWLNLQLGYVLSRKKKLEEAAGCLRVALVVRPQSAVAHNNLGVVLADQKDYAGAIDHYRQALRFDANHAAAHNNWGYVLAAQKDYAGAIDHYQQALRINPNYSMAHLSWGTALKAQNEFAGAIDHFQQALKMNPKLAEAHNNWGNVLIEQKDPDGAIDHYQHALRLDPNHATAHIGWGNALLDQKDYSAALAHFQQAVQLDPSLAMAHNGWGNALHYQKDYAGAITHFEQALNLDPSLAMAHHNWGNALYDHKDYAGAVAHYQQALKLDRRLAPNWESLPKRKRPPRKP